MAEYRETNGVLEKKALQKVLAPLTSKSPVVFFLHTCTSFKTSRNASSGYPAFDRNSSGDVSQRGYGPHFPVLSLPAATDCSVFSFLAVQESSFGSMGEIALFKYLPAEYIAPGNQA